ncbi:hypothetical protein BD779DRAFT_1480901 [Infundibulicybe gibba]|nr:hypothetical protein BD779DRAFT_1480901 [Infundibulicybe gibba]
MSIKSCVNQKIDILQRHPNVNSKGVAIISNKQTTKWKEATVNIIVQGRAILVSIPWKENNQLHILAIYAPNNPRDNANFWHEINEKWTNEGYDKPDLMLGDFNIVEESLDRLPPHPDQADQTDALQNLKPIYVSNAILDVSCDWKIQSAPLNTDHRMISVKVLDPEAPYVGKGRWTIPLFILKDRKIMDTIKNLGIALNENIERTRHNRTNERNAQMLFDKFKNDVIKITRNHARTTVPKIKKSIEKLEQDLANTLNDERYNKGPGETESGSSVHPATKSDPGKWLRLQEIIMKIYKRKALARI